MNVKLLRKVKRHILAEPKRLYMPAYIIRKEDGMDISRPFARCGTAACIAGWTYILSVKSKTPPRTGDEHTEAAELLGLTELQADRLFLPGNWPLDFRDGLTGDGKPETAKVAAARIEFFIKTKGKK